MHINRRLMSSRNGDRLSIRQLQQSSDAIVIQQGVAFEHHFDSPKAYGNPFVDVTFDGVFECNGQRWVVPAFWLGGRRWRFGLPLQRLANIRSQSSVQIHQMRF